MRLVRKTSKGEGFVCLFVCARLCTCVFLIFDLTELCYSKVAKLSFSDHDVCLQMLLPRVLYQS